MADRSRTFRDMRVPLKLPLRGLLGPDRAAARQSLAALAISCATAITAGLLLSSLDARLFELPGLLVLVPAAVGIRGSIFGALGSRFATSIHTGTFGLSRRLDTLPGQNIAAAAILTVAASWMAAVLAKATASAFNVPGTISVTDFVVVSVVGGVLASVVVLVVTVALAGAAVRYGWDLDNVNAPVVSAIGDMVTIPALFAATVLVSIPVLTPTLALALTAVTVLMTVVGWRSRRTILRTIVRESLPILAVTGLIDSIAGVVLEKRFLTFGSLPALLILVPASLSGAGAVGSILSARLSTKLHLGQTRPGPLPDGVARADIRTTFGIAGPVFVLNGILALLAAEVISQEGPGALRMLAISVFGGMLATVLVVVLAYYGTVAATRLRLDPDTYGIPIVTSTIDLVGAYTLVLAIALLAPV